MSEKHSPAAVFFCAQTGKRIVAPGVCKEVDPVKGVDLYEEPKPAPKGK